MTTSAAPPAASSSSASSSSTAGTFDIVSSYHQHLQASLTLPHPIAAIHALCDLLSHPSTSPTTVSELITLIQSHSALLKSSLASPVPATAGTDLFSRLVVSMDWRGGEDFQREKERLVLVAREYAEKTVPACRARICGRAGVFLKEGAVLLTHSYSRVVMQLLLSAASLYRNTLQVYVTESRPEGLGLRTYEELTAAGIPATLVLDTAVAYVMSRVDVVLVGSEGVVESGGVLNAVGTYQLGLIAKSLGKPFYAAAESYKFLRLFPLSQSDLPTTRPILPFPSSTSSTATSPSASKSQPSAASAAGSSKPQPPPSQQSQPTQAQAQAQRLMSPAQEALNPSVDYTPPELVTAIISDVGVLTPGGVADALLMTYGGT